jgi:hypothetical protein
MCCLRSAGANEDWLYRVMRAAVQIGVFEVIKGRYAGAPVKFRNNSLSVVLREDHPNCMKYMVGCLPWLPFLSCVNILIWGRPKWTCDTCKVLGLVRVGRTLRNCVKYVMYNCWALDLWV